MFDTTAFWATLLICAAAWQLLPAHASRARAATLVAGSAIGIAMGFHLEWRQWALLSLSVAWVAVGARWAARRRPPRAFATSLLVCAPMLLAWGAGKSLLMTDFTSGRFLAFIGLSYLVVKSFTLAKDACDGRVRDPDPVMVVAYLLFFPTFVAGPMHLYGEFEATVARPETLSGEGVLDVAFRFLLGMVKARVLAPLLAPMSLMSLTDSAGVGVPTVIGASIVYSAVLLLDFSGYTDMAIASARIIGVRTPENFRWPYLASSIREFWQRWHITFSRVLTSYLFIPITRTLQRRMGRRRVAILAIGYFATFLFCGYWHGTGANFLLWGVYHATGLFVLDAIRSARGPATPRVVGASAGPTMLSRALGVGATFLFVSLGWILFVLPVGTLARIGR